MSAAAVVMCEAREMTLLALIVTLLIVGLVLWAVNAVPFIDPGVKKIIYVVIVVVVCLWLLTSIAGTSGAFNSRLW